VFRQKSYETVQTLIPDPVEQARTLGIYQTLCNFMPKGNNPIEVTYATLAGWLQLDEKRTIRKWMKRLSQLGLIRFAFKTAKRVKKLIVQVWKEKFSRVPEFYDPNDRGRGRKKKFDAESEPVDRDSSSSNPEPESEPVNEQAHSVPEPPKKEEKKKEKQQAHSVPEPPVFFDDVPPPDDEDFIPGLDDTCDEVYEDLKNDSKKCHKNNVKKLGNVTPDDDQNLHESEHESEHESVHARAPIVQTTNSESRDSKSENLSAQNALIEKQSLREKREEEKELSHYPYGATNPHSETCHKTSSHEAPKNTQREGTKSEPDQRADFSFSSFSSSPDFKPESDETSEGHGMFSIGDSPLVQNLRSGFDEKAQDLEARLDEIEQKGTKSSSKKPEQGQEPKEEKKFMFGDLYAYIDELDKMGPERHDYSYSDFLDGKEKPAKKQRKYEFEIETPNYVEMFSKEEIEAKREALKASGNTNFEIIGEHDSDEKIAKMLYEEWRWNSQKDNE
jgi:hypothetical protein